MMKMYVVVRSDLSPGLQIAQSCHALQLFAYQYNEITSYWYKESNNLVVLQAPNKEELARLGYELSKKGVEVSMFREPDLDNELTAIAVAPSGQRYLSTLALALNLRRTDLHDSVSLHSPRSA